MTQSIFGGVSAPQEVKTKDSVTPAGLMNSSFATSCSTTSPRKQFGGESAGTSSSNNNVLDELTSYWEEKDAAEMSGGVHSPSIHNQNQIMSIMAR